MNLRHFQRLSVAVLVLLVALCSWYGPITEVASQSVDDGLKRSLVSFASARALNGVISVLQGTEVAVQPVGVGVSLSVGEILDPINDLVESLSSVMLMASVAFGLQKLLLAIGSNWAVSAFATAIALLWAALYVRGRAPRALTGLLAVLLFARFVMPATLIGSACVFEQFSADEYRQSQAALDITAARLKDFALTDMSKNVTPGAPATASPPPEPAPAAKASGLLDWTREKMAAARDSVGHTLSGITDPTASVKKQYDALKAAAEDVAERMIHLIVMFLMQTVLLPLLLLWGLYRLTTGLFVFRRAA